MTNQFLFEIGTEELPVSFVLGALNAWPAVCERELGTARLNYESLEVVGTPRRLALIVRGLASRQKDLSERVQGPPKSVAFGPDGALSRAGQNFVTKLGIDAAALDVVSTPKGEYVVAERHLVGRAAAEVLVEILPSLAQQIPFPKMMRWGEGQYAFGRPIHWLVVLLDDKLLDVEFAGIRAGRNSRGHRFLGPEAVTVSDADHYAQALANAHVVVQGDLRVSTIAEQLEQSCAKLKGDLVQDADLVKECAYLVEKPHVVAGQFDQAFLDLPEEVIVAVMRGHQRYFAIRKPQGGGLMAAYLTVANTAEDPQNVSRGNDRVLGARLADARFFVHEDAKSTLAERVAALDGVVFQAKLGSVGAKVRRLTTLVGALAALQPDQDSAADTASQLTQAATLCKADLLTLMVGEFPELQGVMGRWYALEQGVAAPVADALRDHYFPKGAQSPVPQSRLSAILAVADRLDTLVGCFGVGIVPDGSTDPFALRRAALGVVRIALEGPFDIDLTQALQAAYEQYDPGQLRDRTDTLKQLDAFVRARLRAWYTDKASTDVIEACLASWPASTLGDLDARLVAVQRFRSSADYTVLATAFKRAFNIAKEISVGSVNVKLLSEPAEAALAQAYEALQPRLQQALSLRAYDRALSLAAEGLRQPIDRFFDEVFVMDDNPAIRANRLQLLGNIVHTLTHIADFRALGN
jgi:glycyl-tRNA synthetase beta chain